MISFKRIYLILLILMLLLVVPAYARDLRSDGIGITQEEARLKARDNLSAYINGVFIESSSTTMTYDDSTASRSYFSSSSNSTSNGYLKAVDYENEYKVDGAYYSTAIIKDRENTVSAFREILNNLKLDIENLYSSISSESTQQKKRSLNIVYGLLTEYETYRTILIWMGHPEYVPSLSYSISTSSIFIEYQNVIIEEGYLLEEKEKYITDETEHQKLLEELSANRTEHRRIEREKNEAMLQRENAAKFALEERLRQYSVLVDTKVTINLSSDETRYSSLRENITNTRTSFLKACEEFDKLCKEQFAQIDKDYEAEKKAVDARPYRYAELNGSNPTPTAKKIRDDEIAYLYTRKEMHKVAVLKQIRDSLISGIKDRYDEYKTAVSAIDGECFEIVLDENTISRVTTSYDPINVMWNIYIRIDNIEGMSIRFSFPLTYKQLSGKEAKEAKYFGQTSYDEYMAYLDDIDYLDTIIKSFIDSFRISIRFKTVSVKKNYGEFEGINFHYIQFILECNALSDPSWSLVVDASPASIEGNDLAWTLPGYSRIFNGELDV